MRKAILKVVLGVFCLASFFTIFLISNLPKRDPKVKLYSEYVGSMWIDMWIEDNPGSPEFGKLAMTIRRSHFELIGMVHYVEPLQGLDAAKFSTIYDPSRDLVCVFDNNNCGFIALVNVKSRELCVGHSSKYKNDTCNSEFNYLESRYKNIPYKHYFTVDDDTLKEDNTTTDSGHSTQDERTGSGS